MILKNVFFGSSSQGYIAGTADSIVTVNGAAARRDIIVRTYAKTTEGERNCSRK